MAVGFRPPKKRYDGLDDLAFDSVVAADVEDGALGKDSDFFDDED